MEIPRRDGRKRKLGIPTVGDRIAQMVAKGALEPKVEPLFHRNSYRYKPGKSAHEAIGKARIQCWRCDGFIDLDIKGFFESKFRNSIKAAKRWLKNVYKSNPSLFAHWSFGVRP